MKTKICNKCNIEKEVTSFYKNENGLLGVASVCKICRMAQTVDWRKKNRKKVNSYASTWRKKNPKKVLKAIQRYRRTHKKEIYLYNRTEERKEAHRKYYRTHRDEFTVRRRRWQGSKKGKYARKRYGQSPVAKYGSYKRGAKARGIVFKLSFTQFMLFWKKPCDYCGRGIKTIGLDRVNNDKTIGYVIGNIKPCCSMCNDAKHANTKKAFLAMCERVVKHQKKIRGERCRPNNAVCVIRINR